MANAKFISDNGLSYTFGVDGSTAFNMDVYSGVSVKLSTAQGFSQIGESVQGKSVGGRNINITGVIFRSITSRKEDMRRVFTPFSTGKLIYNDKYYTNVYVKDPPTFSPLKDNGRFSIRLYAPFPYFFSATEESKEIGFITPKFHFPVNYNAAHVYGVRSDQKYSNVINSGNVPVPFSATITATGTSVNPTITNLKTGSFIKLNGALTPGDVVKIYRDSDFVLRVKLERDGSTTDVLHWVDEASDLFKLNVGDNIISISDDGEGSGISARFSYSWAVSVLYED